MGLVNKYDKRIACLILCIVSSLSYESVKASIIRFNSISNSDSTLAILIMPSTTEDNYKMPYEDLFALHKNQIGMQLLKKELQELGYTVLSSEELINKYNFGKDESSILNDAKKYHSLTSNYLSTIGGANIRIDFDISVMGSAKKGDFKVYFNLSGYDVYTQKVLGATSFQSNPYSFSDTLKIASKTLKESLPHFVSNLKKSYFEMTAEKKRLVLDLRLNKQLKCTLYKKYKKIRLNRMLEEVLTHNQFSVSLNDPLIDSSRMIYYKTITKNVNDNTINDTYLKEKSEIIKGLLQVLNGVGLNLSISTENQVLIADINKLQTAIPISDTSKLIEKVDLSISATKIGNQYWMTKNLSVTKFRNGKSIPFAKNIKEWSDYHSAKKPAFCYERFNEVNKAKGLYYNTWAICDSNLAPSGWRVPSKDDYLQLGKTLGRDAHLKLKSKDQWYVNRVYGNFNGNNKSGFNAYPNFILTGYFDYTGYEDLDYISKNGYFEGANEARFGIACSDEYFQLGNGYTAFPWGFGKITLDTYNAGLMIRCVK